MQGLTIAEETALKLIDREGGRVVKGLSWKTDGTLYKTALVAYPDQMDHLLTFGRQKAAELADRLFAGIIAANPYEYLKKKPCTYCAMQAVCGFEPGREGCHYRRLAQMSRWEVLEAILQKEPDTPAGAPAGDNKE